jgi:acyl-CoA thioesterase
MGNAGATWLGLEPVDDHTWRLPVRDGVTSGAGALMGGGATAAGLVVARELAAQPLVWAAAHFGALAKAGSEVTLRSDVISAGRTMTHVQVAATVDDREAFVVRVAAGERPVHDVQGAWIAPPDVVGADASPPFAHPVHEGTWAARFEWRLAGASGDPGSDPWAAWWVRPRADDPCDPLVAVAVLADYVTYGVGRALGRPMGGLSIDNVLRLDDVGAADAAWLLLEVRPEAIVGGFGHGSARLFDADGSLIAVGTQSMVVNNWDWRLPAER